MHAPYHDYATRALPAPTSQSQTRLGVPEPAERTLREFDREQANFWQIVPKELLDRLEVPLRAEAAALRA